MESFKRFPFFDRELVREESSKTAHVGIQSLSISCVTSGRGHLVFGDMEGRVTTADSEFRLESFPAHKARVTHVLQLKQSDVLVTLGDGMDPRPVSVQEEIIAAANEARERLRAAKAAAAAGGSAETKGDDGAAASTSGGAATDEDLNLEPVAMLNLPSCATLKLWRMDVRDSKTNMPTCVKTIQVFPRPPEIPITCMTALEDSSMIALGLADGSVVVFRGMLLRDRSSVKRELIVPPSLPASELLRMPSARSEGDLFQEHEITGLQFCVRDNPLDKDKPLISLYVITRHSILSVYVQHAQPLNRLSADERMSSLDASGCEPECSALAEDQSLVAGQARGVFFFTPDGRGPCYPHSFKTTHLCVFRTYVVVASTSPATGPVVTIYDLSNKFVAFSMPFSNRAAGRPRRDEGPQSQRRITHLVAERGSVFVVCNNNVVHQLTEKDTDTKLELLFKKNLFPTAIALAQSSNYDASNIMDIYCQYGEHLYKRGEYDAAIQQFIETIGHVEPSYVIRKFLDAQLITNLTTYLEAVHSKQRATADHTTLLLNCYTKLKEWDKLKQFIQGGGKGDAHVTFDVTNAITVLRRARCWEEALYLAEKHKEHDWYLRIQVEDRNDYRDALRYLRRLPVLTVEAQLARFGKTLVAEQPDETTALLKELCTSYTPSVPQEDGTDYSGVKCKAEEFIPLYVNHPQHLKSFLRFIVDTDPASLSSLGWNTVLELALRDDLEIERAKPAPMSPIAAMGANIARQAREHDILTNLLQNPYAKYDLNNALVLVQMHNFRDGQLYLYERLQMYPMIIQHYMEEATNHAEAGRADQAKAARRTIIAKCNEFRDKDPNLWVKVLTYFSSTYAGKREEEEAIQEVLDHIEQANLLPPLLVVQIVSSNERVPLSVLRDYIVKRLSQQEQSIREDTRQIDKLRADTEAKKDEVYSLQSRAEVFQARDCSQCGAPLELPTVHFLCKHSFHGYCIPETETECPICSPEFQRIRQIHADLGPKPDQQEQFFHALAGASDSFAKVAEYFGRGLFLPAPERDGAPAAAGRGRGGSDASDGDE